MNQCLCRSFATALFVSVVATPIGVSAQQISELEAALQASSNLETSPEVIDAQGSVSKVQTDEAKASFETENSGEELPDFVQIISHSLDTKRAATLYVNDIPVLTFVGSELFALSDKGVESTVQANSEPDPADRAAVVGQQLGQFQQTNGSPEAILAQWDAELEGYAITLDDTVLVQINDATILPDTTANFEQDALQATNRLRRLLGGAEPQSEVAGKPEPEPEAPAATTADNWSVTSVYTGQASWYGPGFHGRRTANGEVFNQNAMTAAHRTLPFGTQIRVTNLRNNRQVIVRVNDRGPFTGGRILDLSAGSARAIGLDRAGVGPVRIEVLAN
ncbi:MAG: septal ring lytic transglycosylase RlpA family protein [Cyanobacteria bacterium J06638_28]